MIDLIPFLSCVPRKKSSSKILPHVLVHDFICLFVYTLIISIIKKFRKSLESD